MTKKDDLNTPMVALVGFLGTVIVFVTIILLVVVFRQVETQQHYDKDLSQPYGEITDLATRQRDVLASYGWVDQEKGIVAVPVGRAMELVVAEIVATGQATVTRPGESAETPQEPADEPSEEPADEPSEEPADEPSEEPPTNTPETTAEAPPDEPTDETKEVGDAQPEQ